MPERVHTSRTLARLPRRWFGFGRPVAEARPSAGPTGESDLARLAREGRRELLESIATFLLENDLAISPANLNFAWLALGGGSPNLTRKIAEMSLTGEKVTQEWVDASRPIPRSDVRGEEAREWLDDLNDSVRQFTRTTAAARTATSEYNLQLDQHIADLSQPCDGGDVVHRLLTVAQRMAERTRRAEAELKASEYEAKVLRRRLDKARREADRDHLTGLPNRRAFEFEFERQYAQSKAAHEPLSVAFCDIDHFKHINDSHGHAAGDRVLKLIAQMLAATSVDNCHVSRHGGEEFVLLFRGLTPADAKARLDSAREDLATRRLLNRETDEPFGQITFSAGVANVFAHANPRDALKAADRALYRAKENGRNQVLLA